MKICGIKFKNTGKTYYFKDEEEVFKKNDYVVVETEKGEQYAKVVETDIEDLKNIDIKSMKSVSRMATEKDEKNYTKNLKSAKEALDFAKKEASDAGLDMRIIDASYTLDRKQLTFNFSADERIDFRDLVKVLAAKFKTRIELHQLGVRDKAKEVGGLGLCGRELCCSSFLSGMDTITINMAKNQGLALNPSKINGLCGRLLCCLSYEDEVYCAHRSLLPKMGQVIKTPDGEGKVVALDILNKKYTVSIDGEDKIYDFEEPKKKNSSK